jgi:hypothetical protein
MGARCSSVLRQYNEEIRSIVDIQRNRNREAIFFIYEDGSTTDNFVGKATSINLQPEEEKRIQRQGEIYGSVHTHPTGFDASTIDVVTGIGSGQQVMCIATPVDETRLSGDFVLTCLDFHRLGAIERRLVFSAMRRSSVGITNLGRVIRKELNLKRFTIEQCRVQGT